MQIEYNKREYILSTAMPIPAVHNRNVNPKFKIPSCPEMLLSLKNRSSYTFGKMLKYLLFQQNHFTMPYPGKPFHAKSLLRHVTGYREYARNDRIEKSRLRPQLISPVA
jgi:hypothetical protein